MNKEVVFDHKGKAYRSLGELCAAYKIKPDVYQHRIRRGWSVEKALTTPVAYRKNSTFTKSDNHIYIGLDKKPYTSIAALAKAHNIDPQTLSCRLKSGMPLKKALTTPLRCRTTNEVRYQSHYVIDFNGNIYRSIKEMCDHYGVNKDTYLGRRKRGLSVKESLLGKDE